MPLKATAAQHVNRSTTASATSVCLRCCGRGRCAWPRTRSPYRARKASCVAALSVATNMLRPLHVGPSRKAKTRRRWSSRRRAPQVGAPHVHRDEALQLAQVGVHDALQLGDGAKLAKHGASRSVPSMRACVYMVEPMAMVAGPSAAAPSPAARRPRRRRRPAAARRAREARAAKVAADPVHHERPTAVSRHLSVREDRS